MVNIITNKGAVCDLPKSFQLDNANYESQDMCGPWSVAELKYAGLPGKGPSGTAQNVDDWAEAEYTKYIGPNVLSNQQGSSIDNMHQFLKDAGLHWWDIAAITHGSTQASDIAHIHAALNAGYPVLVTVNEQSVIRRDGSNPYPWEPKLGPITHVFTVVGHTNDGYLLVDDELNATDSWPDQYQEANIECHWACTVQLVGPDLAHPWLKPIPSLDPTAWPQGFNAQNFSAIAPAPSVGGMMSIDLSNPTVAHYFQQIDAEHWKCLQTGFIIQYGDLAFYRSYGGNALCGLTYLGLPKSNEMPVAGHPGVTEQEYERGWVRYDPKHEIDNPPESGSVYIMHLPPAPIPLPDPQIAVLQGKLVEIAKIATSP